MLGVPVVAIALRGLVDSYRPEFAASDERLWNGMMNKPDDMIYEIIGRLITDQPGNTLVTDMTDRGAPVNSAPSDRLHKASYRSYQQ